MSQPSSILSYYDLIVKVAQVAGFAYYGPSGDQRALPPIDDFTLDTCKGIVNDGIRDFIANAPPRGWRWPKRIMSVIMSSAAITGTADSADATSLTDAVLETTYDTDDELNGRYIYVTAGTGTGSYAVITDYTASGGVVTVADWLDGDGTVGGTNPTTDSTYSITSVETVGGDIARYPLDENFTGQITGAIKYAANSGLSAPIQWTDEAQIRALRASNTAATSGDPYYAAVRPIQPTSNTLGGARRYELLFYPQPNGEQTVEFPFSMSFDSMKLEAGVATDGLSTTLVDSTRHELDDYFNGWTLEVTAGTGRHETATITDFTGSTGTFTFTALSGGSTPDTTSVYAVYPANNLHPAGAQFDNVIRSACLSQVEQQITDVMGGYIEKYFKIDLPSAYKLDAASAPRQIGRAGKRCPSRTWTDVEYL